jgi:hypothetical protein
VFLLNSRLGLFSAASSGTAYATPYARHPFSRSYGVILPSSLTRVLPSALGSSPRLPVSVCGTGTFSLARGFSRQCGCRHFGTIISLPITAQPSRSADLPTLQPHGLDVLFQSHACLALLRHPIAQTAKGGTGISTCCPSPTPLGLGLGPDLP